MQRNNNQEVIDWLLTGDSAIRWQTLRDLCSKPLKMIQKERLKIESEGWGKKLLDYQDPSGTWANGLYTPKWISTTYTLLLLRRIGINPTNERCKISSTILLDKGLLDDGGINFSKVKRPRSETCITGLVFGILSYFQIENNSLDKIFDYLIRNQMPDGGWNCRFDKGATHASFHTTLMVLEALYEYSQLSKSNHSKIKQLQEKAHEFLLQHRLYKSHRTGKIVSNKMTLLSFPPRWHYTLLSALDYFQQINHPYDERFIDAIDLLIKKEKKGTWPLQQSIKGKIWFRMEEPRKPSRWNTLRALRVLKWWNRINNL
jgi:hypothetical protein